jgi:ABC-2 type transport system ATP-binding protein
VLELVGLADAADRRVGEYSHGMQKRLSVARALLVDPRLLLIDEATHDLDPDGARVVRELVRGLADGGAIVVWATQRLEEIRAFADRVTILDHGKARFAGRVSELLAESGATRYLLQLRNGGGPPAPEHVAAVVGALGEVTEVDGTHVLLAIAPDAELGDVFAALLRAHLDVVSCREERSQVEEAFLRLTGLGK